MMLKVCSNYNVVQYVDYMRGGLIKEGGPEQSRRSHPIRSMTDAKA